MKENKQKERKSTNNNGDERKTTLQNILCFHLKVSKFPRL